MSEDVFATYLDFIKSNDINEGQILITHVDFLSNKKITVLVVKWDLFISRPDFTDGESIGSAVDGDISSTVYLHFGRKQSEEVLMVLC